MKKITALAAAAALALTVCTAAQAAPAQESGPRYIDKAGQPFDVNSVAFDASKVADLAAATATVSGYSKTAPEDLAVIGRDICEHYAAGFTTEDLRAAAGESLAAVGEAAKVTVCS